MNPEPLSALQTDRKKFNGIIIEEKNLIGKKAKFSIKEGSALKKNMFIK